jgi:uncharacterized membrane protein YdbT with pleckstrin-like domain
MARSARLQLEQGERRVLVVRRHGWLLARPALALLPLLAAAPLYVVLDELLPQAGLSHYASLFFTVDLALCGLLALKWLLLDFARWWADSYVITNRRIIEQQGLITIERREAVLRAIQESNYSISGAEARFFNYGDLRIQTIGRGKGIVFHHVPRPRRLHALLAAQARAAREEHSRTRRSENEINAALTRIFAADADVHDVPTQSVPRITPAAARMQRRLSLLPEEVVVHATRTHPALLLAHALPPLALVALLVAALRLLPPLPPLAALAVAAGALLWLAWAILDWRDDLYVLTTDRIINVQRKPFISEMRAVVQIRALQDVVLRISSVNGRLFNMGTLTLEAGGDPLRLTAVPRPEQFQRLIFEQIDEAAHRDRLREQERLAGTLTEWFKEYHRMQEDTTGAGPQP